MTAFEIKEANEMYIPIIIRLQEQIWFATYRDILSEVQIDYMFQAIYSESALKRQMQKGQKFYILYFQKVPIGFYALSQNDATVFKLNKIYLLPEKQGIGAGRYLLLDAENKVRNQNGNQLVINVNRYNNAKLFYEKMGYLIIRSEDIPIGPYLMNDYVLSKLIV